MSGSEFVCPQCGETEELRGQRESDERLVVRCDACGHQWVRERHICPACGGRHVYDERRDLYQKARGVQQSIIGHYTVRVCPDCGWSDASGDAPRGYTSDDR